MEDVKSTERAGRIRWINRRHRSKRPWSYICGQQCARRCEIGEIPELVSTRLERGFYRVAAIRLHCRAASPIGFFCMTVMAGHLMLISRRTVRTIVVAAFERHRARHGSHVQPHDTQQQGPRNGCLRGCNAMIHTTFLDPPAHFGKESGQILAPM